MDLDDASIEIFDVNPGSHAEWGIAGIAVTYGLTRTLAYLKRDEAKAVIDGLQAALDEAGPEPIEAPDADYLIDSAGRYWARNDNGTWYGSSETLEEALAEREDIYGWEFEHVVRNCGTVRRFKIVEQHVELDTVAA